MMLNFLMEHIPIQLLLLSDVSDNLWRYISLPQPLFRIVVFSLHIGEILQVPLVIGLVLILLQMEMDSIQEDIELKLHIQGWYL